MPSGWIQIESKDIHESPEAKLISRLDLYL